MLSSRRIAFFLLLLFALAAAGCAGNTPVSNLTNSGQSSSPSLSSISVLPANASVAVGASQQFSATGSYSDGSTKDLTASAAWSSSNQSIATINSSGMGSAVAAGSATISATSGSVTGSTTFTVTSSGGGLPSLQSIAITPANPTISAGGTQQFTATGTFSDGSQQNITSQVNWTSSQASVATISSAGLASAVAAGTTAIQAVSGSISSSTNLTVSAATGSPTLQSIAITPANSTVSVGTTQQFTATGTFIDGTQQNITNQVTWTSSQPSVATISSAGLASAVAAGSTTIQAVSGSISSSTTLVISGGAPTLQSIAITPANPTISVGATQQFTATGTFTDGSQQNVTNQVAWKSSQASVATISSGGLASAIAAGSTTIQAVSGAISGSTTLTVAATTQSGGTVTADFGARSGSQVAIPPGILGAQYVESLPDAQSKALLAQAGFRNARTYGDIPLVYATQTPNWKKIDPSIAAFQAAGLKPIIELAFTPSWLLGPNPPCGNSEANPPSDPNVWGQLAASYVAHFDQTFPGFVQDYEIWNEPNTARLCAPPNTTKLAVYEQIYAAAAPKMKAQAQADGQTIRVGGPATAGVGMTSILTDPSTAPYVDFYSYHLYPGNNVAIFNGMTWDGAGGTPSLYQMTINPGAGEQARYLQASAAVSQATTPLGPNTPIYLTEYNDDWFFADDCCRNSPVYSPVWNAMVAAQLLNSIYSGAHAVPTKMVYFAANNKPFCLIGVLDPNMDCAMPTSFANASPYPQWYAYDLMAGSNYLDMVDGGHMASSISVSSDLQQKGLIATAFYTGSRDSILIVNPTATPLASITVQLNNSGYSTAQATVFTLNANTPQISSQPASITNSTITISVPAFTVVGISITGS